MLPVCIEFSTSDFQKEFPFIYSDPKVKRLADLIDEEEINDIDAEENKESELKYRNFVKKYLNLIIDVLVIFDNYRDIGIFQIKETSLIV